MGNSITVAFDVFALGFAISFGIAVIIKVLMSGIRFAINKTADNSHSN